MNQTINLYFLGGVSECEIITYAQARSLDVRYVCTVEGYDIYEDDAGEKFYAVR